MEQVAVFVDAGYLFAAGSALLAGEKQAREQIILDNEKTIEALSVAAAHAAPLVRLLRIYWYDGIRPYQSPNAQQTAIGVCANIKLRLGMINSFGQQKGVDALIVTDLIDLARNNAISDALILAGDEDVRVGVQVAQTFGVRVHLLGIEPSRSNQSPHLVQEVDTQAEMDKATLSGFMHFSGLELRAVQKPMLTQPDHSKINDPFSGVVATIVARFEKSQISDLISAMQSTGSIPREMDAPILAEARKAIGRELDAEEKRNIRKLTKQALLNSQ